MFQASFAEVSGIGWNFITEEKTGNENQKQKMLQGISYGNITLKRPVASLDDPFSKWVNSCLTLMLLSGSKGWIRKKACDVIIKLLDANGKPLVGWACYYAYPMKYDVSSLNAEKSGLAMETVILTYNRLERVN